MINESKILELIKRRKETSLTIKAFCANEGIPKSSCYYWPKKLIKEPGKRFIPLLVNTIPATLSGVVNSLMNQNIRDGGVFIFMNRHQNVMKILHMEYAGLVIYHKRLESGRFKLPAFDENTASITINWQDLMSMVQSVRIRSEKPRKIVIKNLLFC